MSSGQSVSVHWAGVSTQQADPNTQATDPGQQPQRIDGQASPAWVRGHHITGSGLWRQAGGELSLFSSLGPFTLAKTKIQKTQVFCCTVYTARKTHNIRGFWHEKRMREKTRISYWCFGKWCACATSLYLWPYTCSAHYVAGRGRVIPLKVMYHVTKTRIIPARLEWAFTLAKNQWNFGGVSKNHAAEVSFSIRVFWSI